MLNERISNSTRMPMPELELWLCMMRHKPACTARKGRTYCGVLMPEAPLHCAAGES